VLLRNPFTKALWDARRSLPGWAVAVAAVGAMYAAFWPSMNTPQMADALAAYPRGVLEAFNYNDLTSPQGYLGGSVYGLLVPLLVAVFTIGWGARTIAGDEGAGTLDLVLAHPVDRARLALQRFAGLAVGMVVVAVALLLAMLTLRGPAGFSSIGVGAFVAMNLHLALFGVLFGALAFAVGAATGSRAAALGTGAAIAVLGYLGNSVLPQLEALAWTRKVSPFHWYAGGDPLVNGVQWGGVATLVLVSATLVALGTVAFTRRDIAV
jgi:ABC-2 type transport system permease protein